MYSRYVTEHLEGTPHHGIRASFAIGTINAAGFGYSDLDAGGMLLSKVQDRIFDTALYLCVNLAIL